MIYNSFCRNGRSEDYAAGLVYMAGLVRGLPAVPGLKKVTADASGFIALTPEGMAGTSQDLPAAETAVMAVAQGSIAARCFDDKFSGAAWAFKPSSCILATRDRVIAPDILHALAKVDGHAIGPLVATFRTRLDVRLESVM